MHRAAMRTRKEGGEASACNAALASDRDSEQMALIAALVRTACAGTRRTHAAGIAAQVRQGLERFHPAAPPPSMGSPLGMRLLVHQHGGFHSMETSGGASPAKVTAAS
jgi:hypothetical protein